VRGILSADKGWRSEVEEVTYSYSDGVNTLASPPLVNLMTAGQTQLSSIDLGGFVIAFSHVHGDQRVVSIHRSIQPMNAPSAEAAEQALKEKYGDPDVRGDGNTDGRLRLLWSQPGRAACWKGALAESPSATFDDLHYESLVRKHAAGEWALPPSLGDCGYTLSVVMNTPTATSMDVRLVDYGAMYRSEQAAKQWVEELEAQATEERKAKAQVPRF
jgi:hypothetical protein